MPFGQVGMVLSFARGRARRIARELLDLEFRLDVAALTAPRSLRPLRAIEGDLRRDVERCVRELASLCESLDRTDTLREAIVRTCGCYDAHRSTAAPRGSALDVSWALALRHLEHAINTRAPQRAALAATR